VSVGRWPHAGTLAAIGICAIALPLAVANAGMASEISCEAHTVRNLEEPLTNLPSVRQVPENETLTFGPAGLQLKFLGPNTFVGEKTVGFLLSFKPPQPGTGRAVNWTADTTLTRFSRGGASHRIVSSHRFHVERLKEDARRFFSFEVSSKPGLYTAEVHFLNQARKGLGRFGEHFRVLPPVESPAITIDGGPFTPDDVIATCLENYGTFPLSEGKTTLESFDGTSWMPVSTGPWYALPQAGGEGFVLPGKAAPISRFRIPGTVLPGAYRVSWVGQSIRGSRLQTRPAEATADFEVVAP
jgi:hypothetical protein